MTFPQERLGDHGQRYVVMAEGYPDDGEQPIAYTNDEATAARVARSIALAPRCKRTWIKDRGYDHEVPAG